MNKSLLVSTYIIYSILPSLSIAQTLNKMQIKQIEEIAQNIASQHNANSNKLLDEMTISSKAIATGRNVRFENVLRVKKGLSATKLKTYSDNLKELVIPQACNVNKNNIAFDRGLNYTFFYVNTYGEPLAEFNIDKNLCASQSNIN